MSVKLEITSRSMAAFSRQLAEAAVRVEGASRQGMDAAAQELFGRTQLAVPRVTGALASSGKIGSSDIGRVLQRAVGYGDATVNPRTGKSTSAYATQVHEIYNKARPDSYKWLEKVLQEFGREGFIESLAASIRTAL